MKIALIGYGRMGHMIEEIAESRGHEIVCAIDVDNPEAFDSDAFRSADVAIEFSMPSSAYSNVRKAFDAGLKVVSGTTGWFANHRAEMEALCADGRTLFWSSNFSIGVYIFSAVNNYLAGIMDKFDGYDVAMDEVHHCHKLDSPSGTAVTLAEGLLSKLSRKDSWTNELAPLGEVESMKAPVAGPALQIFSYRHDEVPASIRCAMRAMPTASSSPMRPSRAGASPSAPSWPRSIQPPIPDCSGWTTFSRI